MSFAVTAIVGAGAFAAGATAVTALAVGAGAAAIKGMSDGQKKQAEAARLQADALSKQTDAVTQQANAAAQAIEDDKRATVEAKTKAAVDANAQIAGAAQRRRVNALAMGGDVSTASTLGGGTSVLGSGAAATVPATRPAATVLGSAAATR